MREITLEIEDAEILDEEEVVAFPAFSKQPLKEPKHEAFCQLVAAGEKRWKAFVDTHGTTAKDPSNAGNAGQSRLMKRKDVSKRVEYLQYERACRNEIIRQERTVEVDREYVKRLTTAKLAEAEMTGDRQLTFKYVELLARMTGAVGGGGQHLHLHEARKDARPGGEIVAGVVRELQSFFPSGPRSRRAREDGDPGSPSGEIEG